MSGLKTPVLIVEDDEALRRLLEEELSGAADEVHAVDGGDAALDVIAADARPWVVVLDLNLPRLDGFGFLDAVERLELAESHLKVVIVSAMPADSQWLRRKHVRAFLPKPFRLASLLEVIRTQLEA